MSTTFPEERNRLKLHAISLEVKDAAIRDKLDFRLLSLRRDSLLYTLPAVVLMFYVSFALDMLATIDCGEGSVLAVKVIFIVLAACLCIGVRIRDAEDHAWMTSRITYLFMSSSLLIILYLDASVNPDMCLSSGGYIATFLTAQFALGVAAVVSFLDIAMMHLTAAPVACLLAYKFYDEIIELGHMTGIGCGLLAFGIVFLNLLTVYTVQRGVNTLYCQFVDANVDIKEKMYYESVIHGELVRREYVAQTLHDIGTPLATFSLGLDLLFSSSLVESVDYRDVLETMKTARDMMCLSRKKAMDYFKHEAGKDLNPNIMSTDIHDLVLEKCRRIITGCTYSMLVPITFEVDPKASRFIHCDRDWIWECIINYLSNAQKFTKQGSIHLSVQLIEGPPPQFLRFEVKDTGPGVPEDKKDTLFQPFAQLQRGAGGTGLGLYSVKQKITILGGTVGVYPNPEGQGSVFFFTIPYHPDVWGNEQYLKTGGEEHPEGLGSAEARTYLAGSSFSHPNGAKLQGRDTRGNSRDRSWSGSGDLDYSEEAYALDSPSVINSEIRSEPGYSFEVSNDQQGGATGGTTDDKSPIPSEIHHEKPVSNPPGAGLSIITADEGLSSPIRGDQERSVRARARSSIERKPSHPQDSKLRSGTTIQATGRQNAHHSSRREGHRHTHSNHEDRTRGDSPERDGRNISTTLAIISNNEASQSVPASHEGTAGSGSRDTARKRSRDGKRHHKPRIVHDTHTTPTDTEGEAQAAPEPHCILVVEDDLSIAKFAQRMLQQQGFAVNLATNGEQGLYMMKCRQYYAVLTDTNMPIMGGYEQVRLLREWESHLDPPREHRQFILSMSADANDSAETALNAGMDGFVPKPVDLKAIIRKTQEHYYRIAQQEEQNQSERGANLA